MTVPTATAAGGARGDAPARAGPARGELPGNVWARDGRRARGVTAAARDPLAVPPIAVPIAALETFLRDLHEGPAQDAATVKLALVVWRQAVARGDTVVAREMLAAAVAAADRVAGGVTVLLATGRGWLDGGARPEPSCRAGLPAAPQSRRAQRRAA